MFKRIAEWHRKRVARRTAYREFKARVRRLGFRTTTGFLVDGYISQCGYCNNTLYCIKHFVQKQPPVGTPDLKIADWQLLLEKCCYLCGKATLPSTEERVNLFEFLDDLERKQDPYSVATRRVDEIHNELHRLEQRRSELTTELEQQRKEQRRLELEAGQSYREPPLLAK